MRTKRRSKKFLDPSGGSAQWCQPRAGHPSSHSELGTESFLSSASACSNKNGVRKLASGANSDCPTISPEWWLLQMRKPTEPLLALLLGS